MKRVILAILLVMLCYSPSFGDCGMGPGPGVKRYAGGGTATCGGSDTDFGYSSGASWVNNSGFIFANASGAAAPGTGTKQICTLKVYAKYVTTQANIRVAVYSTKTDNVYSGLICQGSAQKAVTSATGEWISWTYGASELSGTCQLTGGTTYYLVVSSDGSTNVSVQYGTVASGAQYVSHDYTGGFDDPTVALTSSANSNYNILVGVQ